MRPWKWEVLSSDRHQQIELRQQNASFYKSTYFSIATFLPPCAKKPGPKDPGWQKLVQRLYFYAFRFGRLTLWELQG